MNHLIEDRLPSSTHVDYSMFSFNRPGEIQLPVDASLTSLPAEPVPRKVFIHGQPKSSFFKLVYASDMGNTMGDSYD
jgi:hypothetical protein